MLTSVKQVICGLAVLLAALSPRAGMAGAWLREEGAGFFATSIVQHQSGQTNGTLFLDYGWRPKLTLGLRIDADMTQGRLGDGSGFAFLRRPIGSGERRFNMAYELGIGATFGHRSDALLLTGLSYGRGLSMAGRDGWLAIDGSVEWSLGNSTDTAKLDTTVGMALNDRFKIMMQVFYSRTETASSTTLAPSVIWQPKDSKSSYQFGVEAEGGAVALKLGLWRSF